MHKLLLMRHDVDSGDDMAVDGLKDSTVWNVPPNAIESMSAAKAGFFDLTILLVIAQSFVRVMVSVACNAVAM